MRDMKQNTTFSIIIYAEHEPESLAVTLQSIADQWYPSDLVEIIVLDSVDSRERQGVATAFGAGYVVPRLPGRAVAWNEGVALAKGDVVVFTDDDCRPQPEWLAQYERPLARGIAMAGGPDKVPESAPRFLKYLDCVLTSFAGSAGLRTTGKRGDAYYPRHWNMALLRRTVVELGSFNEKLADAVELDFANRARTAGHAVGFVPGVAVLHARETDLFGFLQRNVRLGWVRASLPRKRLIYAAPALVAAGALVLLAAAQFVPSARAVLAAAAGAYGALVFASGIRSSLQMRDPLAFVVVPLLIFLQHLTHAVGYGVGIAADGLTRVGEFGRGLSCRSGI
ncbi:MAG: glycosyltransferase [Armatimonadetes bacterium]|nr:glycosyltransferase [Armatimonadota bacterium]